MKKQITLTEKLAEAVEKYGMRIAGEGTMTETGHHFYLVTAREYATTNRMYVVEHHDGTHTCNCPARKPCVHIALVAQTLTQALKDERAVAISDSAKWALIEQIMPERAEAAHQAATEVQALLGEMSAKMDANELDENLWGASAYAEQQAEAERLASLPRELANVETSEEQKLSELAQPTPVEYVGPYEYTRQQHAIEVEKMAAHQRGGLLDAALQAERSRKREAALLVSSSAKPFSLYASE